MYAVGMAEPKTEEELRREEFEKVHLKTLLAGQVFKRTKGMMASMMSMSLGGGSEDVFVKLGEGKAKLEWATLEQKNGSPVDSGTVAITEIIWMTKKGNSILIRDKNDAILLEIEAPSADEQENFRTALQEAVDILQPELDGRAEKESKQRMRLAALEARKIESQKKKDALGPVGMTATAKILMREK